MSHSSGITLQTITERTDAAGVSHAYAAMCAVRGFEERAYQAYNGGEVRGSIHSSVGHEAIASAAGLAFGREDYLACTHRGHGHAIARGTDIGAMFAELMGKATGTCQGRGGSMHLTDRSVGLIGANGIVGASVELAVGAALSIRTLNQEDRVAVASFGDGAVAQGSFHEGMNLASLWRLPIVFLCENNQYSVTAHVSESISSDRLSDFALPYTNITGVTVDGRDQQECYEAFVSARARAAAGEGPTLIEARTYRFKGHSRGDPAYGAYRSKEAHLAELANDPIERYAAKHGLGAEAVAEVDAIVADCIEQAISYARSAPEPDPATVLDYVY